MGYPIRQGRVYCLPFIGVVIGRSSSLLERVDMILKFLFSGFLRFYRTYVSIFEEPIMYLSVTIHRNIIRFAHSYWTWLNCVISLTCPIQLDRDSLWYRNCIVLNGKLFNCFKFNPQPLEPLFNLFPSKVWRNFKYARLWFPTQWATFGHAGQNL